MRHAACSNSTQGPSARQEACLSPFRLSMKPRPLQNQRVHLIRRPERFHLERRFRQPREAIRSRRPHTRMKHQQRGSDSEDHAPTNSDPPEPQRGSGGVAEKGHGRGWGGGNGSDEPAARDVPSAGIGQRGVSSPSPSRRVIPGVAQPPALQRVGDRPGRRGSQNDQRIAQLGLPRRLRLD